jgi:hypothetical protein
MLSELSQDSPTGQSRRAKFHSAIEQIAHKYSGLGMEMNQRYHSGAVFQKMKYRGHRFQRTPSFITSL